MWLLCVRKEVDNPLCFVGRAGKLLQQWKVFPLPLDNLYALRFDNSSDREQRPAPVSLPPTSGPTFYRLRMRSLSMAKRCWHAHHCTPLPQGGVARSTAHKI